jgi:hypothetical protein
MRWIATQTVTSVVSGINFTNIPQNFTHLQAFLKIRANGAGNYGYTNLGANNDYYGTTYAQHAMGGDGVSLMREGGANLGGIAGLYCPAAGNLASTFAHSVVDILDYTRTDKWKTFKTFHCSDYNSTSVNGHVVINSGVWKNNAAITTLNIFNINFEVGSTVDLYGYDINSATGA